MADLVPTMTSNTAPSGTASAAQGTAWYAFDDNAVTCCVCSTGPGSNLRYDFTTSPIVESYTITATGSPATGPSGWVFQGSSNGTDWTPLDTQTGIVWTGMQTKSFAFSNADAYSKYRLSAFVGGSGSIYNFEMWTGPHTPILPTSVASAVAIGQPYVVVGVLPPDGVVPLSMPTFRPELLSVGVGPLSGTTPALANPTLDITDMVEGLAWDATTRGGLGGLSFYLRQPTGSRSTKTSTNLCPDPEGTAVTWWPA